MKSTEITAVAAFSKWKSFEWAFKKLPKSIPEALKNDSVTVISMEQSD